MSRLQSSFGHRQPLQCGRYRGANPTFYPPHIAAPHDTHQRGRHALPRHVSPKGGTDRSRNARRSPSTARSADGPPPLQMRAVAYGFRHTGLDPIGANLAVLGLLPCTGEGWMRVFLSSVSSSLSRKSKTRGRRRPSPVCSADHAPGMIYRMLGAFCTGELLSHEGGRGQKQCASLKLAPMGSRPG